MKKNKKRNKDWRTIVFAFVLTYCTYGLLALYLPALIIRPTTDDRRCFLIELNGFLAHLNCGGGEREA